MVEIRAESAGIFDPYIERLKMKGLRAKFHWRIRNFLRAMKYINHQPKKTITSSEFQTLIQISANTTTLMLFFQTCKENPIFCVVAGALILMLFGLLGSLIVWLWPGDLIAKFFVWLWSLI